MQHSSRHEFLATHVLQPLALFATAVLLLEMSTVDTMLADRIYQWADNSWVLRDAWFTRVLIHDGGRRLVAALGVLVLVLLAAGFFVQRLRAWRRGLCYLLVSTLAAGLLINVLKKVTHVDCPWDLVRYGGAFDYVRNFARHPATFRYGSCFPAGHASAAYAWFGFYYLAREYRPRLRLPAILAVLFLGVVFGIGQQLRGAHFLSHDVWTLGLCWFISTAIYPVFYGRQAARVRAAGQELISRERALTGDC